MYKPTPYELLKDQLIYSDNIFNTRKYREPKPELNEYDSKLKRKGRIIEGVTVVSSLVISTYLLRSTISFIIKK